MVCTFQRCAVVKSKCTGDLWRLTNSLMYGAQMYLIPSMRRHLKCIDDSLNVRLDSFMGKLRAGQCTHALQSQITQVGFPVLQELAKLVAGSYQQGGLTKRQHITISCSVQYPPVLSSSEASSCNLVSNSSRSSTCYLLYSMIYWRIQRLGVS